jgi:hypothetical protein
MGIRDLIEQIAANWSDYHQKHVVDKQDSVYSLVVQKPHEVLSPLLSENPYLLIEGSSGRGNITAAPWIALFDRRITTSATTGYYVVYLFSVHMSTVTLTLAFGTTQFEKQFGGPSAAFPRMRLAATRLQDMFEQLIPDRLSRGSVNLYAAPRQKLQYAYQQSAILSYPPYAIPALPPESELAADLQELVRVYSEMVSDPLEATVDRLVEAVVEPPTSPQEIEALDFTPRPPAKVHAPGTNGSRNRRYSPESKKVGNAGEQVALKYEVARLTSAGRPDLAERIVWHAKDCDYVGWDITSFNLDESVIYIEVKASLGKTISTVCLTVNEWEAALDPARRNSYYVYIVTSALSSNPVIERLRNPAGSVENAQLSCEPIVYELDLRQEGAAPDSAQLNSSTSEKPDE